LFRRGDSGLARDIFRQSGFRAKGGIVLIVAIIKVTSIWIAVSVAFGFVLAPALARQLRKNGFPPKTE
jgi:hypothetical protein